VDFGATDSLLSPWDTTCTPQNSSLASRTIPSDLKTFPDLVMMPAVASAIVPTYNVPHVPSNVSLVFSRQTLKNIYMGNIQVKDEERRVETVPS
jgi:ABC-type phosphate transport system substrate-binding protein